MYRTGLTGPGPLVTDLAAAVMQWRSLERLAHAGVCVEVLCDVSSEQSFLDTSENEDNDD